MGIMIKITQKYLDGLKPNYIKNGYNIPKWILFSEIMLNRGYNVDCDNAITTVSKYIYVQNKEKKLKIRFSNHKPNKFKQSNDDCNFYVGVSNNNVITTEQVIQNVIEILK